MESKKAYEFRRLSSEHLFPMIKIVSKIGIKSLKLIFTEDAFKDEIQKRMQDQADGAEMKASNEFAMQVGADIAIDIADVLLSNLPNAESEIYGFLALASNLSEDQVRGLPMATFLEMVLDLVSLQEFSDFFGVVASRFKSASLNL